MRRIYFDRWVRTEWPSPLELEPFFHAPKGQEWSYLGGNDEWSIKVEGLDGTANRDRADRVDATLTMTGTPDFGVFLHYRKWDGRLKRPLDRFSRGDMNRLGQWLRTLQSNLRPIALFVPYVQAWKAVKEFMERDGELPTSIEWVAAEDLPPNTFRFPGFFKPGPEPRVLREDDINDEPPDGADPFRSLRR